MTKSGSYPSASLPSPRWRASGSVSTATSDLAGLYLLSDWWFPLWSGCQPLGPSHSASSLQSKAGVGSPVSLHPLWVYSFSGTCVSSARR